MDIGPVSTSSQESDNNTSTLEPLELSPIQRVLKEHEESLINPLDKDGEESFFDSEQYLYAKIAQLQGQLDFYSNIPSGISDNAITSIGIEIKGLFDKIREKAEAQEKEAADIQAVLDEKRREKLEAESILTPEQLIERAAAKARGEKVPDFNPVDPDDPPEEIKLDPDILTVEQLLDRARAAAEKNNESLNLLV